MHRAPIAHMWAERGTGPCVLICLQELRGAGLSCQAYHADMEASWREGVHLQWSQGKVQVGAGAGGM
jgi:hypothetical protein